MIGPGLHIPLAALLATPAVALTPIPVCSGEKMVGGFAVWDVWREDNGFVFYYGGNDDTGKGIAVLEHCGTGQSVVADTRVDDVHEDPGHMDNVNDALADFTGSARSYTLRQIASGLKARGITVRRTTLNDESCACATYHPDLRGNRKPFN